MMRNARFAAVIVVVALAFAACGRPVQVPVTQAFENRRAQAEAGDAAAQYALAMQLRFGVGVPQDLAAGAAWLLRAAEKGYLEAQFTLGLLYQKGHGVPQDYDKAVAWLLQAAEQDHRDAQFMLGLHYQGRNGEPRDDVEAVAWLRTAAEGGHPIAMSILSGLYAAGRGVIKDPVLASMWHFLAAYRSSGRNRDQMIRMAELMARALTRVERREALRLAAEWDAAHPQ